MIEVEAPMLIDIEHLTTYTYDAAITLGVQHLRLKPRTDPFQRLAAFELDIDPSASTTVEGIDLDGGSFTRVSFEDIPATRVFEVKTRSSVETTSASFDEALVDADARRVPLAAQREPLPELFAYTARERVTNLVASFAESVSASCEWRAVSTLSALARRIHSEHRYLMRPQGAPRRAEDTLARKEGSCRDFTVLFIECVRHLGFPARFVSGYHVKPSTHLGNELHAWAEVFLPGAGWRGFDPTIGQMVDDRHVAVAAAASPAQAAPVTGTFLGAGVSSTLTTRVDVRSRAEPPS